MHIPVLKKEVLEYLNPKPNENFIDATIGFGGHTSVILERNKPKGKVLGIEADHEFCKLVKKEFSEKPYQAEIRERFILVNDSYINLKEIVKKYKFQPLKGILFDLGMSSWHLKESGRGFSFQKNEPLDMRYNQKNLETAERILNYRSFFEIEKILREYGEEEFSQKIAGNIVATRKLKPIRTTSQLVEIVKKSVPFWYRKQKRHFATFTFQALRIEVNDELNNLEKSLPQTLDVLAKGGRLVIISFHSLEDRIVKNFFLSKESYELDILTKKPVIPTNQEVKINPSSRSAKLRAAVKK